MRKTIQTLILFMLIFTMSVTAKEFSADDAKKVDKFLKSVQKMKRQKIFLRKKVFTEKEINSYINLIYVKRYTPEVKYIKMNLERKNSVSGNLKLLLKGKKYKNVPSFLKDVEIDFAGTIECEDYRMRFLFDKIDINGNSFNPEVLDEAFSAFQVKQKVKKSMFDWFKLLPGLKNVQITKRKITLYY